MKKFLKIFLFLPLLINSGVSAYNEPNGTPRSFDVNNVSFRGNSTSVNLALNKKYTILPKPNYNLCTDSFDNVQLTDGKTYGSDWFSKSTVGWQRDKSLPEITIDLEKRCALDEVQVFTIGGGRAGVHYPDSIVVMVSDDNKNYKLAGFANLRDKLKKSLKSTDKEPLTVSIKTINAHGRYVKVVIQFSTTFVFIDEIEVFGRTSKETASRQIGDTALTIKDSLMLVDNLLELKQSITSAKESISRLNIDPNEKLILSAKLQKTANDVNECEELSKASFASQKATIAKIKAEIYKAYYKSDFVISAANPMKPLLSSDTILEPAKTSIELSAWQGEYESAAVNVINCSENTISVRAAIEAVKLNGTVASEAEKCFTLRRAVYVKAKQVGDTADALVLQDSNAFTIEGGAVAQLWLTYFNPTLKAGSYHSRLEINAVSNDGNTLSPQAIDISLTIEPIVFNQNIALNTYNWAYPKNCAITKNYLSETAYDLRSHYTNVIVIHPNMLAMPKHGNSNFAELDNYLVTYNFARTYLIYMGFNQPWWTQQFPGDFMTATWQSSFSTWLKNLISNLKAQGIDYSRFALYPYDEQLGDNFVKVAKLIKAADPKIRIFANNLGSGTAELDSFKNLIDIWCPATITCERNPEWLAYVQTFGKQIWTYDYGSEKSASPWEYYRKLPWLAFKRKQTGAGFWVYTDEGQVNPWDELMKPRGYYGVIYSSADSPVPTLGENIIPSRRWEAWREGVEDYQYLYETQQRIAAVKTSNPSKAAQMQATLDTQVNLVLNNSANPDTVYSARQAITDMLKN